VQDLDLDLNLRPVDLDLDLDLRPMDLDLTPPDLRLGLDTSRLDFFDFLDMIFKVFLQFSLMGNPDSQSEILNQSMLIT